MNEKSFAQRFGEHICQLREKRKLSLREFARNLEKETGYTCSHQTISRIEQARIPIDPKFIEAVATFFKENPAWLACLAGQPPDEVIERLVDHPDDYLYPILVSSAKDLLIAVPEVLQIAHVFSIIDLQRTSRLKSRFRVRFHEKGREALQSLKTGAIFAITTTAARIHAQATVLDPNDEYVELIELMAPRREGLYYLYRTDADTHQYAYLKDSIGEDLAAAYEAYQQERQEAFNMTAIPVQSLEQVADKLIRKQISGWFGWPAQDLKVLKLITEKLKTGGSVPPEFHLSHAEDIDKVMRENEHLERNLVIMTTKSALAKIDASVITDLTDYLIQASKRMLLENRNEKERAEVVLQALCQVKEMSYLACDWWKPCGREEKKYHAGRLKVLEDHLSQLTFHITIREAAFPYLTGRGT